jgi:exodeoxyribonuclease VIII
MNELEEYFGLEPGIYPDMPNEDYHRKVHLPSASMLNRFARSPKQAKDAMDHPTEPTDAMIFGTRMHCMMLEPKKFVQSYIRGSQCLAVKKDGKRCENDGIMSSGGEMYCGVHCRGLSRDNGVEIITETDMTQLERLRDAVMTHPVASLLIQAEGGVEHSIIFRDKETDVLCKMRADKIIPSASCVLDLKTAADGSPDGFAKAASPGYFRQAALYLRGMAAVGKPMNDFTIVAIEKETAEVCVYRLADEDIELASADVTQLLLAWDQCEKSGKWPGYSESALELQMPAWSRKTLREKLGLY